MSVDQAREEWQAAGDYDSACRLIRAQAARIEQLESQKKLLWGVIHIRRDRIEQLERELVAERENNVGEFESRSEAQREVRALKAKVVGLERDLADFKASQHYRYIGIDVKPVLARELEDRAIKAERELAGARQLVFVSGVELGKAEAQLAAEKALADQIGAQLKIAESALSDIGDAEREDGDDLKWCERRAAKAIPSTREALAAHRKARGL